MREACRACEDGIRVTKQPVCKTCENTGRVCGAPDCGKGCRCPDCYCEDCTFAPCQCGDINTVCEMCNGTGEVDSEDFAPCRCGGRCVC